MEFAALGVPRPKRRRKLTADDSSQNEGSVRLGQPHQDDGSFVVGWQAPSCHPSVLIVPPQASPVTLTAHLSASSNLEILEPAHD
jgi:hypothetical protein